MPRKSGAEEGETPNSAAIAVVGETWSVPVGESSRYVRRSLGCQHLRAVVSKALYCRDPYLSEPILNRSTIDKSFPTTYRSRMTRLLKVFAASIAFLVLALAQVSRADGVTYTFSGTNGAPGDDGLSVAFEFNSAGFIDAVPSFSVFASQLESCSNCLISTTVPAIVFMSEGPIFGDQIDFSDKLNVESVYAFPLGAFSSFGTYSSSSPYNTGTLTVSPTLVTPEPGSRTLLVSGILLLPLLRSFARYQKNADRLSRG